MDGQTQTGLNRRQFLTLAGFTAIAASPLLAACGSSGSSGATTTSSAAPSTTAALSGDLKMVWGYNDAQVKIKDLFTGFQTANPGVNLQMLWNADEAKLIAGGTPPDMIHTSDTRLDSLSLGGDLSAVDVAAYYPYTVDPLKVDGTLRALPLFINTSLLYYNKDLFDAAGVAYPTPDWKYADLLDAARKLTKRDGNKATQWGLEVEQGWWGSWLIAVRQAGGDFMDDQGNVILNSPEAIAGMTWFNSLMQEGPDKVTAKPSEDNLGGFKAGKVAMSFGSHTGNWGVFRAAGLKFDVQILPEGLKQRRGAELAMDAEATYGKSANPEAAVGLLTYITSKDASVDYWSSLYGPTPRKDVAEALLAVPAAQRPAPQNLEAVYGTVEQGLGVTNTKDPNFVDVAIKYVQPKVDLMIEGKIDPATAMNEATKAANDYLATVR